MDPTAVEIRVLGCLIEKQRTTPDAYPLSLNALRLACNQSTNRDPVVHYDEAQIRDALAHLYRRGWTRLASGHGSRAAKYRHLLDEALGLAGDEIALLAVLMLRGAQTPGELKQRTDRLHPFADLAAAQATLDRLIARGLVARLARRPGQKEERYAQLLGGADDEAVSAPVAAASPSRAQDGAQVARSAPVAALAAAAAAASPAAAAPVPAAQAPSTNSAAAVAAERDDDRIGRLERELVALADDDRLARLERELAELRAELTALREALGE
ncbi:MAG: hypothetical protein JWQ48_1102 [Conexibacter sp.]|nr:hypothetical protein [Conexibacter sp.]